jgi:hypothetical protein
MTAWADAKKAARQVVHDTFALPGIFYETEASTPTVDDDVVTVRIHDKPKLVGDLAGTNLSYAETAERPTRAIFQTSELDGRAISRGSMVVMLNYMGDIVGYFVDNVNPPDGLTTTCDVTPLSAQELSGKLLPDGTTVP